MATRRSRFSLATRLKRNRKNSRRTAQEARSRNMRFEPLENRLLLAFDTPSPNFSGPERTWSVSTGYRWRCGCRPLYPDDQRAREVPSSRFTTRAMVASHWGPCRPVLFPAAVLVRRERGDPIVLYDQLANRWLVTEFAPPGQNTLCAYVSQTADPTDNLWYEYQFSTPNFPDYPKYAVSNDAYFVTTNEGPGPAVYALDRTSMLQGVAAATPLRFTAPRHVTRLWLSIANARRSRRGQCPTGRHSGNFHAARGR